MLEKAKLQLQQYLNDDEPNRWHACALAIATVFADSIAAADPGSAQCMFMSDNAVRPVYESRNTNRH